MIKQEKVLEKIRHLLELAADGKNDEESQTALLLAQKLMLKHKISEGDLQTVHIDDIVTKSLSVYKRLYWWEKQLAQLIADNFRVLCYVQSQRFPHQTSVTRKMVYMGYYEDVQFALAMYELADETMKHYATLHANQAEEQATRSEIRHAYYQGFLAGLADKFQRQREQMVSENDVYALVLKVPQEVQNKFNAQVNGKITFKQPPAREELQAYHAGFEQGKQLQMHQGQLATQSNE